MRHARYQTAAPRDNLALRVDSVLVVQDELDGDQRDDPRADAVDPAGRDRGEAPDMEDVDVDDLGEVDDAGDMDDREADADAAADADVEMLANARRRHGALGTVLAAGMLGLEQALGRKPKEEIPVVVASNSDPLDIDTDGITIDVDDDVSVVAPPMPRGTGSPARKRSKRRRGAA